MKKRLFEDTENREKKTKRGRVGWAEGGQGGRKRSTIGGTERVQRGGRVHSFKRTPPGPRCSFRAFEVDRRPSLGCGPPASISLDMTQSARCTALEYLRVQVLCSPEFTGQYYQQTKLLLFPLSQAASFTVTWQVVTRWGSRGVSRRLQQFSGTNHT